MKRESENSSILIILDDLIPLSTAGSVRVHSFAQALGQVASKVMVMGGRSSEDHQPPPTKLNFQTQAISRPPENRPLSFLMFILNLYAHSIRPIIKTNIVIISVPKFEMLGLVFFARIFNKKCVVDFRDSPFFLDYQAYFAGRLPSGLAHGLGSLWQSAILLLTNQALKHASLVTCANNGIKQDLLGLYPNSTKKITTVPNGVSDVFLAYPSIVSKPLTKVSLLYCGNFSEKDRFDPILELLSHVHRPVQLILIGEGRNKANVLRKLHKKAPKLPVVDLGLLPHSNLPFVLEKYATVGVMFREPNYVASIPVGLIEMLSLGIPVIVNDIGEMGEFAASNGGKLVRTHSDLVTLGEWLSTLTQRPVVKRTIVRELKNRLSRKTIAQDFATKVYEL